ncbi:type II toxin-antitoxin system RelB/DinJ family antitoxin [Lachnoanaerobaculum orale]|mgnify:FL=1|jgi:addiction module antitoxin, relB/dinJ family|uniref:Addiction module antitoxin, RelB/DinJ family n=3 Tax=Lachnoanaerobaculum TaxID=1164882 RepID=I0R5U9_9FIRM|nr:MULTISPECIES: type II toxin-antitoxin system RelB/DinJ family antitoxin [Lachnoanaerobaculum]MBF1010513.1 type II toxin-antitoxin system RelB/DinJ family antitoxin [Lachnoanaerobaculum sp.]MBS6727861.1 type II toxin-antitoxin system RelB/DinJ family antitoxin [Lachnospiraceae bacterium oral taxon 082]MDU5596428.1 type II toxin-antitoxin system RelB/DinJ family antitoxin [Lachnospiraceae bacterium]EFU76046.1 addiction module antitoxin, RelB/DinJ family [Lachnoanaerobaculum saburreum DSM 3986]
MAQISFRVDDEIKKKAERTFDDIGISMSAAINIYLKTVVRENRIPFELSADPFYSDENMSRLRESIRQVRDGEKKLTEHEIIEV